jgi:hypothetical protein
LTHLFTSSNLIQISKNISSYFAIHSYTDGMPIASFKLPGVGMKISLLIFATALIIFSGCQDPSFSLEVTSDVDQNKQSIIPDEELPVIDDHPPVPNPISLKLPLAWESQRFPERSLWSDHIFSVIEQYFNDLDLVRDADFFCPNYFSLNRDERINFWGQLFSAISYFESGWRPTTRYQETTMGIDPVTNQPVYSEGLLQLSYQDTQWAKWCEFDWNADKKLSPTDPLKTILNPQKNLSCGVGIMARQIRRQGQIILSRGAYWAVILKGGRFQKLNQISEIVRKHDYCVTKN